MEAGPAFQIRLVLAADSRCAYGIYGPPYETFEATPRPRAEEYLNTENTS